MKLLLYCTKAKPYLYKTEKPMVEKKFGDYHTQLNKAVLTKNLNGKIIAECDFEVEEIEYSLIVANNKAYHYYSPQNTFVDKFYKKSCLNHQQLENYLGYKNGYAIHIKNLHIFDNSKEFCGKFIPSIRYVYTYDNNKKDTIGISISPEELCRILNKEQTIIIKKKVLKEMLINE